MFPEFSPGTFDVRDKKQLDLKTSTIFVSFARHHYLIAI